MSSEKAAAAAAAAAATTAPKEVAKKEEKKGEPRVVKKVEKSGEERSLEEQLAAVEKTLDAKTARLKTVAGQIREKEQTRNKLRRKVLENRAEIKKVRDQQKEKRQVQRKLFDEVQKYMKVLHERKNHRSVARARLVRLLPDGASLPPLRGDDEFEGSLVSDYDRAIALVRDEVRDLEMRLSTAVMSMSDERRVKAEISTWNRRVGEIQQLQIELEGPQAEAAETDVKGNLETCRKLEAEIAELNESCKPFYEGITAAIAEMAANRADLPKLLEERDALVGELKGLVARLHKVRYDLDVAHYKAGHDRFEKRRAEALKESEEIKARFARAKEARAALLESAKNNLPHEHELETARRLLAYLRSVALPGTCGVTEESFAAAAAARAAKAEMERKRLVSAPSVEIAEDVRNMGTERVVSRKEQPVAAVGKKAKRAQAKKAAAAAAAAAAPKKAEKKAAEAKPKEEKPKQPGDKMKHAKSVMNDYEELSLAAPATYADADKSYHELEEKIAEYEKVRALVREEREKALMEPAKKEEEEAPKEAETPKEEEEKKEETATPAAESQ